MKDTWGEDYVSLAFRVEKYFEGFIDGYFGPEALKARIEKEEKKPLDALFEDAVHLYETVPREDEARRIYLEKQVTGIKTTIRVLQGEEIDYGEQVELFYDVCPEKIPDSHFEKYKQALQDMFKGEDLNEALDKWRKTRELPENVLTEAIRILHEECRRRTGDMLSLPEGEHIDFVLVNDKPWSGYNWYLGTYASRVEINTDLPVKSTELPPLVSHESYPGHHTEHAVKEKVLYRQKGFTDASVFVYNTPECLISEGIGNAAFGLIFKDRWEAYQFLNERMNLSLEERDARISEALKEISSCSGNASLMIHRENAEIGDVVEYLVDVGLSTKERAEKTIQFITNPLFRAYIFNYFLGEEVVSNALKEVSPRVFYENQMCLSNLKYFR